MTIHSEGTNPADAERDALTYLITAFRFRERGLRGIVMEPDLSVSRPLAEFLLVEGFRRSEVPHRDQLRGAPRRNREVEGMTPQRVQLSRRR